MKVRCLGGWTDEVAHGPVMLADKEPLNDPKISDGACDRCCRAMQIQIVCRWCGKVESATGLCLSCVKDLGTRAGAPFLELTIYRSEQSPVWGTYDGAGAVARLGAAIRLPSYCGFALRQVGVPTEAR